MPITRRHLLSLAPVGALAPLAAANPLRSEDPPAAERVAESLYPSQDPDKVRAIVGASHRDIDRVRALLAESPALAKASWDWGFGDWETALGAASHTGRREIAALLIEHGARPDIFTFAMLGHVDAVRACVLAQPGIQRIHGPHGITLMRHAQAGGEAAEGVVKYLTDLGDADIPQPSKPLTPEAQEAYLGTYSFGPKENDRFIVDRARNGELALRRGKDGVARQIFFQGDHAFAPAGAPAVTFTFTVSAAAATALRVDDGPKRLSAQRVAE